MLQVNGIDHINLNVKNLKNSVDFYQKYFGFKVFERSAESFNKAPYAIIGKSNVMMLVLNENPEKLNGSNLNHIGINIKNFDEAIDFFKNSGIEIQKYNNKEIIEYSDSRSFYIKDPDDYEIELSSKFTGGL